MGGFGGFWRFQKLHINYSICPFIRLLSGLLFNPSGKYLNFMHFFPAKTGTSPANSLTDVARTPCARGGEHEENRSHH
jgi:hypothetical protein